MTKTDMQAAARLDPASADAAYTASLLCTRAAINENLVRGRSQPIKRFDVKHNLAGDMKRDGLATQAQDWTSDLDMERLAGYFIQSARPSDEAYMVRTNEGMLLPCFSPLQEQFVQLSVL